MLEPRPPRRDPRVLAIRLERGAITYAALDAWQLRGLGTIREPSVGAGHFELELRRLIVQTKPSAIVCAKPRSYRGVRAAVRAIAAVAALSGLPLVSLAGNVLKELLDEFRDAPGPECSYPELRGLEGELPTDAVRLALAAFTKIPLPPRRYAPTRPSNPATAVGKRRHARPRPISLRHRATARRRARRRTRCARRHGRRH